MPASGESKLKLLNLFASVESMMKQIPEYQEARASKGADVNWSKLRRDAGPAIGAAVDPTIREKLLTVPPFREIFLDGRPTYDTNSPPLQGGRAWQSVGARLIEASVRVRNNVVHGGKQDPTRERYSGHDQVVVDSAIVVLTEADRWLRRRMRRHAK